MIDGVWRRPRADRYLNLLRSVAVWATDHPAIQRAAVLRWSPRRDSVWLLADSGRAGRLATWVAPECDVRILRGALTRPRAAGPEGLLLGAVGFTRGLAAALTPTSALPAFLVVEPFGDAGIVDDLRVLAATLGLMIENLGERQRRRRAERQAITDPLTRLANRSFGLKTLRREVAKARRDGQELSLLMVDLDGFKALNDRHGHLAGDRALRVTANVLRQTVRESDVLFRYGGEEFLAILPNTRPEDASVLAARLFVEVEASGRDHELPVTVSIGLATLRPDDEHLDTLIGRADRALYASKARGRNRFSADID